MFVHTCCHFLNFIVKTKALETSMTALPTFQSWNVLVLWQNPWSLYTCLCLVCSVTFPAQTHRRVTRFGVALWTCYIDNCSLLRQLYSPPPRSGYLWNAIVAFFFWVVIHFLFLSISLQVSCWTLGYRTLLMKEPLVPFYKMCLTWGVCHERYPPWDSYPKTL